jgi:type II secretory pathway pseudopilin PulG
MNKLLNNAAQQQQSRMEQLLQQREQSLLEQQMRAQLAQQYTSALGQSMVNTKNTLSQQAMQGVYARSAFDPNASEAYQIPLSQLITLWQAKFNDTWVDMGLEHESFWRHAHRRLSNAHKFENVEGWVRLLEDA